MIIWERMLILSEYPKYNRDVLYYLRASLPRLITANAWGCVLHGIRIIVQVLQYSEMKANKNDFRNINVLTWRWNQWQGRQWRYNHPCLWYDKQINCNQLGSRPRPINLYRKRRSPRMRRTLQLPSIHIIYQELQGRCWRFWRGLMENYQAKRSQGSVEDIIVLVR